MDSVARALFQSTLPAWGETAQIAELEKELEISIHSPRMGRDADRGDHAQRGRAFQSTLPAWGETKYCAGELIYASEFQSTLPAWGETRKISEEQKAKLRISIHSPRMGRDGRGWDA